MTWFSLFAKITNVDYSLSIEWSPKAIKDMRQLASRDRDRIIAKVEQYARDPASLANQVIALTGEKHRRLRVGRIRVLFSVEEANTPTMVLLRVRHRREAYD